jgi:hypothetical protein
MQKASRMLLVVFFLLPTVGFADTAESVLTNHQKADLDSLFLRKNWQASSDVSYSQFPGSTQPRYYPNDELPVIASLDFRDPGAFSRVSKLRELSLLTLAELGETRLFFGVNDNGLFGLHLGARPLPGNDRSIELARMPYLRSVAHDGP